MNAFRVALANLRIPPSPEESVALAEDAVLRAAGQGARIICFPECYVPGYRYKHKPGPPPDAAFLARAWDTISAAAAEGEITVVLGTERLVDGRLRIAALVVGPDGEALGFQDKIQLDPSEEGLYYPGQHPRRVFSAGPAKFGVSICHEGWRYPETVRAAVRQGAQLVFHPHFHEAEPGAYRAVCYADPKNTFHEKAMLCRAAENACYIASVNCADLGSNSTSAVIRPDGTLECCQPYGKEGLLIADLDLDRATGLLASRYKPG